MDVSVLRSAITTATSRAAGVDEGSQALPKERSGAGTPTLPVLSPVLNRKLVTGSSAGGKQFLEFELAKPLDASDLPSYDAARAEVTRYRSLLRTLPDPIDTAPDGLLAAGAGGDDEDEIPAEVTKMVNEASFALTLEEFKKANALFLMRSLEAVEAELKAIERDNSCLHEDIQLEIRGSDTSGSVGHGEELDVTSLLPLALRGPTAHFRALRSRTPMLHLQRLARLPAQPEGRPAAVGPP